MGFNLWDIGAVATGAIERDREHTKENLAIRADELAAKRNSLIQRKNKKYEKEINSYYKEKETMDKINSLNSEAALFNESNKDSGKTYDKDLYASRYLIATMGATDFNAMTDNQKKIAINNFQTTGANYEMQTKDPAKLAALQDKEENIIFSNYAKELRNAKDNSFLINKILGKSTTATSSADLEQAVNADVNASKIVTKLDKAENSDKADGTSIKLTETMKAFIPTKDWKKAFVTARDGTTYDLKGTQVFSYLNTLGVHGGNDELSLKFNKTDSGIDGQNANSMAQIDFMKHMFNQVKDSKTVGVIGAVTGPDNFEKVGTILNTDKVLSEMTSILDQNRSGNIKEDIKVGWGGDIRLTTFVPLNVADAQGKLIIKGIDTGGISENQMGKVNGLLNDFIVAQAKLNPRKDIDAEGKAVGVYRKLYMNEDAAMLNAFNEYMLANNKGIKASYEKALAASKEETDTTTKKTSTETTGDIKTTDTNFTLGVNTKNERVIVVPEDDAIPGRKKGDKIKLNKENIEKLKSLDNAQINSLISEGTKFETEMEKAPLVGVKTGTSQSDMEANTNKMNEEMKSWFDTEANKKKLEESKKNFKRKR